MYPALRVLRVATCSGAEARLQSLRSEGCQVPLYQYECTKGHSYEKQQPFGSPVEHPCEHARCKATAKRVLIPPQVHFKGSGWYKTDSRGSGSTSRRSSSSAASDADPGPSSVGASTSDDTSG